MRACTLLSACLLLLAGCASAPARVADPANLRLADDGRVAVSWNDPVGYREVSCRVLDSTRDDWVRQLAVYTRTQAERHLPPDARLDVHFNDIDRAGECLPGRSGNEYRIVRDIYPPRISLNYRWLMADGATREAEGVQLTDLGYLMRIPGRASNQSLEYEKRLIDDWLRGLASGAH
ncbi:MAG: DUF3016 domain-containing protein [Pseudomonadota bacterium]|nr:DUF3016 domain-containing protein [Pseudomonadota bacterium]